MYVVGRYNYYISIYSYFRDNQQSIVIHALYYILNSFIKIIKTIIINKIRCDYVLSTFCIYCCKKILGGILYEFIKLCNTQTKMYHIIHTSNKN